MDEPLNSPHHRSRGWRQRWAQTVLAMNAGRRLRGRSARAPEADPHHQVHSDETAAGEERDLEENRPRAPPTAVSITRLVSRSVPEVFRGLSQDELEQEQKRCSKYSQKALLFAITMFVAYLGSSSASSCAGNTAFKMAMAAFFIAIPIDLISATRTAKWGRALVCISWFFLVILCYLLLISFHKDYSCAIIPVLLLIFAAVPECKLHPNARQQNTTTNIIEPAAPQHLDSDAADKKLEDIFDKSAGIVNCGGLISMILGHYMYMVGPNQLKAVSAIGFLFFFTVVLGLYLMMVTTVRTEALILYVTYLACLLDVLLVGTLIATLIQGFLLPRNDSHV